MKGDLTARAHVDIDAPALALARFLIFPRMEMLGRWHNYDIAPALIEIGDAACCDRRILRRPEGVALGKIEVIAEQIGDGRALESVEIEQCEARRDRLPAEQPLCRPCNYAERTLARRRFPSIGRRHARDNPVLP